MRLASVTPAGWAGLLLLAARAAAVLAGLVLLAGSLPATIAARTAMLAAGVAVGLAAGVALQPWVLEAIAWSDAGEPLAPAPRGAIEWPPITGTVTLFAIASIARLAAAPILRIAQQRPAASATRPQ